MLLTRKYFWGCICAYNVHCFRLKLKLLTLVVEVRQSELLDQETEAE